MVISLWWAESNGHDRLSVSCSVIECGFDVIHSLLSLLSPSLGEMIAATQQALSDRLWQWEEAVDMVAQNGKELEKSDNQ